MTNSKEPELTYWSTTQSLVSCVKIRPTRQSFGIQSLISTSRLLLTSSSTNFISKFLLATGFSGCTTSLVGGT